MRLKALVSTLILLMALVSTCWAEEIVVSAAASLTESFTEAKAAFEKANPGDKVTTNFAASGPLLQQIEQGAPVDVFASADQETMDKAQTKKLIDQASRMNFAGNTLALITPAQGKPLTGIKDLTGAGVARIAIGNPDSVPVGRYAREALQGAGIWDAIQAKIIPGNSVKQVLDYAVRGEVDAAIVFGTDAKAAGAKVKLVETLGGHKPVTYPIALVAASKKKDAAKKFIDYILSPAGKEILGKYGFKTDVK
jgi:molybdate transport system substrate-binding protein